MGQSIQPIPREGEAPYLSVDDDRGLLTLVQFGAVELHPGGARRDRLDRPDRLVFDLDPGPGIGWPAMVEAAHELRRRLQDLKLVSFCRTSGGKGLHLVVPIERRHDWPTAKAFTATIARAVQADSPDRYTATLAKRAREGRIFIDYLRNDRNSTAIATWSVRSRPGAPVATPLAWEEVTTALDPRRFTVLTVPKRARDRADPWEGIDEVRQRMPASYIKSFNVLSVHPEPR